MPSPTYILEVADWCHRDIRPDVELAAATDAEAISLAEKRIGDPYAWAVLPDEASAWAWPDKLTIRGWNYTGDNGTYQMRLRRK